jgi:methylamine utilization protein MauE
MDIVDAISALALRSLALAAGLVLVFGALQKLRDWPAFREAVAAYRLLPDPLVPTAAWVLPATEALAGAALLVDDLRIIGACAAMAVVGIATAAVAINVRRGRTDIDCGCGGLEGRQRLSWGLVARNAVLIAVLGVGIVVPGPRMNALGAATLVAATLAFVTLFIAVSQLVANRPFLVELRRQS